MSNKIYRVLSITVWLSVLALIFYMSHQNGAQSSKSSGSLTLILEIIFRANLKEGFIRTAAHFSEFTVLGLTTVNCALALKGYLIPFRAVIFCALYAITDEIHQIFIPGRACQFSDFTVDMAGVVTGVFIFTLVYLVITESKKRRKAAI